MALNDPDAAFYEDRYCPACESMTIGKKIMWAAGGVLVAYLVLKFVLK